MTSNLPENKPTAGSLVQKLLTLGGVEAPAASNPDDLLSILESWLGLPEATIEWETEGMEDVAPFQPSFYQALESLLVQAWNPPAASQLLLHSNIFLELDCSPDQMSLVRAMDSLRITRLLRYWMELNVRGNIHAMNDGDENEDAGSNANANANANTTLTTCLLFNATLSEGTPSTRMPAVSVLIQALYHHIEQLPFYQSQIHLYTQSLTRGDTQGTKSGQALTDTQTRLDQYQRAQQITSRLNQEWQDHIDALEYIVGEWYGASSIQLRRQSRRHLGSVWAQFVGRSSGSGGGVTMENTTSSAIPMTLRLLYRILQGTSDELHKSHEHLLHYHLLPLHRPSSMVLWRDQTSLLELYHEPLVQCIAILLQKKPEWISQVLASLMEPDIWNKGGNTPKLVLLLHELDTYIGLLPDPTQNPDILGDAWPKLLRTVGSCMASDHSRLAERALTFIKTSNFRALIQENYNTSLLMLLPFLVKHEPSWNPTVRKMTYNVLKTLQDMDGDRFLKLAQACFPNDAHIREEVVVVPPLKREGTALRGNTMAKVPQPVELSLKSAMGSWKPPTGARRAGGMPPSPSSILGPRAPPLGVTGVAPWSMKNRASPTMSAPVRRPGSKNPPLGVTGVAPWAVAPPKPPSSRSSGPMKRTAGEALSERSEEAPAVATVVEIPPPSSKPRVLAFMEQIKPAEEVGGTSSWSKAQMAETPTLLPKLKFHDLVFGHDLGSGAFGSVRYARLIDRSRTRSHWSEYAVKIISTEKIKEMGYEASVQRELAVLRVLSHPSIARLVSSFRFREGVYLVLEYANGGDLHSLLRKNGSLDHDSTRFVMGEVVAALASIHDMGLVYADLKPENIVITETGHVKLTDFGGSRPVTEDAKQLIESVAKNLLKDLRDGDWKPKAKVKAKEDFFDDMSESKETEDGDTEQDIDMTEDIRIEGTTAYLPPEVVMGGFPSPAADSWALGCVVYQCLSGRPPILESDETSTRNRIVSFDSRETQDTDEHQLFSDAHGARIEVDARHLILQLLNRHSVERPSMSKTAEHPFFSGKGSDVFTLYRQPAHPLDIGDVTPVANAQWTRRQFSSIWAPQPRSYDIPLQTEDRSYNRGGNLRNPIPEGEEATTFFSKSSHPLDDLRHFSKGKVRVPLPTKKLSEE